MEKQTYYTHDNGGRPFRVDVEGMAVRAHACMHDEAGMPVEEYAPQPFWGAEAAQLFVGESPLNAMTAFSGGAGPEFLGNSILVRLASDTLDYVFIGRVAFVFRARSVIVEFLSPVGNNDVPYPYALDCAGNTYLPVENVVVLAIEGQPAWAAHGGDPYDYYYRAYLLAADAGAPQHRRPLFPLFRGITGATLGGSPLILHYHPNPAAWYDALVLPEEDDPTGSDCLAVAVCTGDAERPSTELTKRGFIELMRDFGQHAGLEALVVRQVLNAGMWA